MLIYGIIVTKGGDSMVYSRKQFADKIGVSFETLRQWERKGLIKPLRTPTGRPFYTEDSYEEYINSCKNNEKKE